MTEGTLRLAFLGDANSIHLRRWVGWFGRRGHVVHLLVPDVDAVAPGLEPSIRLHSFEPYTRASWRPRGVWRARSSLRAAIDAVRPDVLHAHYLTVHGWHARLSGFHPYVVTTWGSDVLVTARSSRGRWYAWPTLRGADLVTADSAELIRASIRAGARPSHTHAVQFGVDLRRFLPGPPDETLRARLGLSGRRIIFAPRGLKPVYRPEVVLAAVATLPDDVGLIMTTQGAERDPRGRAEHMPHDLGIEDRVRFLPTIDHEQMGDYYRLADVVVSVAASDGTPVSILEALASGRPVVATDLPSIREWLISIDPGSLVPVDDVAATASALRRALLRSHEDGETLAAAGRRLVELRADQERSMKAMEALYRGLAHHPA